jgi:hypothetical protein
MGFSSDPGPGSGGAWIHHHETGTPNLIGPSMDRFAELLLLSCSPGPFFGGCLASPA